MTASEHQNISCMYRVCVLPVTGDAQGPLKGERRKVLSQSHLWLSYLDSYKAKLLRPIKRATYWIFLWNIALVQWKGFSDRDLEDPWAAGPGMEKVAA